MYRSTIAGICLAVVILLMGDYGAHGGEFCQRCQSLKLRSSCKAHIVSPANRACCNPACNCRVATPNWTCKLFAVLQLTPQLYVHYAEFNECDCDDPYPVYVVAPLGSNTYEDCDQDECTETLIARKRVCSMGTLMDEVPHAVVTNEFSGLADEFPATYVPPKLREPYLTLMRPHRFVKFRVGTETIKAKLFTALFDPEHSGVDADVNDPVEPPIVCCIAVEIKNFPITNPNPPHEEVIRVQKCRGQGAYCVECRRYKCLLLTDPKP